MKNVLITGHSSGIGKAIVDILEPHYNIIKIDSRVEDSVKLEQEVKSILKQHDIDILINCAGVGIFRPHEELNIATIKNLIDINLTAPIILTNLVLRSLKKKKRTYYKY
jgi:short-subunit dehydrogenase